MSKTVERLLERAKKIQAQLAPLQAKEEARKALAKAKAEYAKVVKKKS